MSIDTAFFFCFVLFFFVFIGKVRELSRKNDGKLNRVVPLWGDHEQAIPVTWQVDASLVYYKTLSRPSNSPAFRGSHLWILQDSPAHPRRIVSHLHLARLGIV